MIQNRLHKRIQYVALAGAILVLGVTITLTYQRQDASTQQSSVGMLVVGKPAPDFMLSTFDGVQVSLSQFKDQPVLINFWASWCYPCREEMPEFVRSYESHKAEGFMILGVNLTYSDDLPSVQAFASEFNITFPVLLDEEAIVAGKIYQISGLPTSVFINRNGTVERIHVGVMDSKQVDQYVAGILGE